MSTLHQLHAGVMAIDVLAPGRHVEMTILASLEDRHASRVKLGDSLCVNFGGVQMRCNVESFASLDLRQNFRCVHCCALVLCESTLETVNDCRAGVNSFFLGHFGQELGYGVGV